MDAPFSFSLLDPAQGVGAALPAREPRQASIRLGRQILAIARDTFGDEVAGTYLARVRAEDLPGNQVVAMGLLKRDATSFRFIGNLLLAFLPSAVLGLALHKYIEVLLGNAEVVAVALVLGGIAILVIERLVKEPSVPPGVGAMPWSRALGIGLVQCLAMIPGVSRSGATIMGALALGVERRTAAEFSFFLAVPTMLGATTLEVAKNYDALASGSVDWGLIGVGFVVSFLVALVVIRWFVGLISRRGFAPFAWYRIVAGSLALAWLLAR